MVHIRIGVVTGRASLAADLGLLHDVIDWRILAKEIAGIGLLRRLLRRLYLRLHLRRRKQSVELGFELIKLAEPGVQGAHLLVHLAELQGEFDVI